jgi:hypothetical protein
LKKQVNGKVPGTLNAVALGAALSQGLEEGGKLEAGRDDENRPRKRNTLQLLVQLGYG